MRRSPACRMLVGLIGAATRAPLPLGELCRRLRATLLPKSRQLRAGSPTGGRFVRYPPAGHAPAHAVGRSGQASLARRSARRRRRNSLALPACAGERARARSARPARAVRRRRRWQRGADASRLGSLQEDGRRRACRSRAVRRDATCRARPVGSGRGAQRSVGRGDAAAVCPDPAGDFRARSAGAPVGAAGERRGLVLRRLAFRGAGDRLPGLVPAHLQLPACLSIRR